ASVVALRIGRRIFFGHEIQLPWLLAGRRDALRAHRVSNRRGVALALAFQRRLPAQVVPAKEIDVAVVQSDEASAPCDFVDLACYPTSVAYAAELVSRFDQVACAR